MGRCIRSVASTGRFMGSARINHLAGPFSVSRHATIPDGASGSFCPHILKTLLMNCSEELSPN